MQWKTSRLSFGWSLFNSIFSGLRPIVQTYVLAQLLSGVSSAALQKSDPQVVYWWLLALLVIELVGLVFAGVDRVIRNRFQQKMEIALNERFFVKMYELSQEQFDDEAFNTKLDRARDSLFQIWRVSDEISQFISSLIGFFGSIAAILIVAPLIGFIIIITATPVALINMRQNRRLDAIFKEVEPIERVAYRSRWMLIDPNYMPEIRLMSAFKKMISSWRVNMVKSQKKMHDYEKRTAIQDTIASAIQPLVSVGANIYFFQLVLTGTIGFDRFIFLRGMLEQAGSGASQVATSFQQLHLLFINLQNYTAIYDTPAAIPAGTVEVDRPLTIEFSHVSFRYPNSEQWVLDDVSFVISPGTKLAIVGENGAGKTTLIKLLLRQYLPSKGNITINGTDIKDVKQESYYAAISHLSQDFLIVSHLTIKDNLVLGLDKEPELDEIYKNISLVGANDFINKLPHKLDSRLDTSFDEGTNLSGGQNQRLGVARALLRKGDLMILDEPTSAIDAKAEYMIFKNIYESHAGKTTLIVSHRFSTVRKADKIIVMEQGKITQLGSHDELLLRGGLYKEMFETQAEGYR